VTSSSHNAHFNFRWPNSAQLARSVTLRIDRAPDRLTRGILRRRRRRRSAHKFACTKTVVSTSLVYRSSNPTARRGMRWCSTAQHATDADSPVSRTRALCLLGVLHVDGARPLQVFLSRRIATRLTQRLAQTEASPPRAIKLTFHFHRRVLHRSAGAARRRGSAAAPASMTSWMTCVDVAKPRPPTNHGTGGRRHDAENWWTAMWTMMPQASRGLTTLRSAATHATATATGVIRPTAVKTMREFDANRMGRIGLYEPSRTVGCRLNGSSSLWRLDAPSHNLRGTHFRTSANFVRNDYYAWMCLSVFIFIVHLMRSMERSEDLASADVVIELLKTKFMPSARPIWFRCLSS